LDSLAGNIFKKGFKRGFSRWCHWRTIFGSPKNLSVKSS